MRRKDASSAKKRKRYLEVFFTTVLRLGSEQILKEYRGRQDDRMLKISFVVWRLVRL